MRTTFRRSLTTAAAALALAVPTMAMSTSNAEAAAGSQFSAASTYGTGTSDCTSALIIFWHNGHTWAQAVGHARAGLPYDGERTPYGYYCTFELERSTNSGASWYNVSAEHWIAGGSWSNQYGYTDEYWDGPGYVARTCLTEEQWDGAADWQHPVASRCTTPF